MKTFFSLLLLAFFLPVVEAKNPVSALKKHKAATLSAPNLRFIPSPGKEPMQGQVFSAFLMAETTYSNANILVDNATLDGAPVGLVRSSENLWVFHGGEFSEIRSHVLSVAIATEDKALANEIRKSISSLNNQIANLNKKIAVETNPTKKALLIAQRDEKLGIVQQLVAELSGLRQQIGTQSFAFSVKAASNDSRFPVINSIAPSVGTAQGGVPVTITGQNFAPGAQVKIGGIAATSVVVVNASTITASSPSFGTNYGAKDVEVSLPPLSGTARRNAIYKNGFYAREPQAVANIAPVAVTSGHQTVTLGQDVVVDGTQSYDPNPSNTLDYLWQVLASPAGSVLTPGTPLLNEPTPHGVLDKPGFYVVELKVRENNTPDLFESSPSLTTIQVNGTTNTAPAPSASPISVLPGASATSTVNANDNDPGQVLSYALIGLPAKGTATISGNVVTYRANANASGSDSISVRVRDNGKPSMSGDVQISVSITEKNRAPRPTALKIAANAGQSATSQIVPNDPDSGQTHSYSIVEQPSKGTANVGANGLVSFTANSNASGPDSLKISVTDNGNPAKTAYVALSVMITGAPVNQAPAPTAPGITVMGGASNSSLVSPGDPNSGQSHTFAITAQPAHGTASIDGNGLVTYTANASYDGPDSLIVTVTDNGTPQLSGSVTIFITVTPGPNQAPVISGLATQILTSGQPVYMSFSPTAVDTDGSIVEYKWNYGDGTPVRTFGQSGSQHYYAAAGEYTLTLTVKDNEGLETSQNFTVEANNTQLPSAKFYSDVIQGSAPLTVNFNATASSHSSGIASYAWSITGPGAYSESGASLTNFSYTFADGGVYDVELRVRSNDGAENVSSTKIYVGSSAPSYGVDPVAHVDIFTSRFLTNQAISFSSANSFDPEFSTPPTFTYNWNFGDGGTSTNANPTHAYGYASDQMAQLVISDGLGGVGEDWRRFFVVNTGIEPYPWISSDVTSGPAPLVVNLNGLSSYDPDGSITGYLWTANLGDPGSPTSNGATPTFTYTNPGIYVLSLIVTDNDGNNAGAGASIVVEPPEFRFKSIKQKLARYLNETRGGQQEKNQLAYFCGRGVGKACYDLGKIYESEGNTFAAEKYYEKACAKGYQAACPVFGR